jgi:hypothetical protein
VGDFSPYALLESRWMVLKNLFFVSGAFLKKLKINLWKIEQAFVEFDVENLKTPCSFLI